MNQSPVGDFVLAATGFLLFFGLGLAGLAILFLSARRSRSKRAVVSWGLIAAFLMLLECLLFGALAGIQSATSTSQHGYTILGVLVIVFAVSLVVYFPLALALCGERSKKELFKQRAVDEHNRNIDVNPNEGVK